MAAVIASFARHAFTRSANESTSRRTRPDEPDDGRTRCPPRSGLRAPHGHVRLRIAPILSTPGRHEVRTVTIAIASVLRRGHPQRDRSHRARPCGMDVRAVAGVAGAEHLGRAEPAAQRPESGHLRIAGAHGPPIDDVDVRGDAGIVARVGVMRTARDLGDGKVELLRQRKQAALSATVPPGALP